MPTMKVKQQARLWSFVTIGIGAVAGQAQAVDPWEGFIGDDGNTVVNTLAHGSVQQHDLDRAGGPTDQDWMLAPTVAGRSYEARVTGVNAYFDTGSCSGCADLQRVDSAGTVLQQDVAVAGAGFEGSYNRSIRWIATSTQSFSEFVRVKGNISHQEDANSVYTIRFWDTTYGIPRWNASNGQVTVFLIQNMIDVPVSGVVRLHTPNGMLVHEHPFTLAENQLDVWNVGTVAALVGLSGHAYVVHNAGYGGLAGKAVALEPATGFSFDSPMQPIPD